MSQYGGGNRYKGNSASGYARQQNGNNYTGRDYFTAREVSITYQDSEGVKTISDKVAVIDYRQNSSEQRHKEDYQEIRRRQQDAEAAVRRRDQQLAMERRRNQEMARRRDQQLAMERRRNQERAWRQQQQIVQLRN